MMNRRILLLMLVLGLAVQGAAPSMAEDDGGHDGRDGHDSRDGHDNRDGGKDDGKDDSGGDSKDDGGGDGKDDSGGGGKDDSTGSGRNDDGGGNPREGGDNQGYGGDNDDWIRREVREGKVAPLRKILATIREQYGGQVVRVRLTGQGGKRLYWIRIIDTSNQLIEVQVNASTGNIVVPSGIY